MEVLWQAEVDATHYDAAPYFYGLASVALIAGRPVDQAWLPTIAGVVVWFRVALVILALGLLAAVRARRLRGELAFGTLLLCGSSAFAAACAFASTPTALIAVGTPFAVGAFLWPATLMLSRAWIPALASGACVLVYGAGTALHSPLPRSVVVSTGFIIVFLAGASPFIYALRYRLQRSNFQLRIALEQQNRRIADQAAKLEGLASVDALTGAYNRRVGLLMLEKSLALAKRSTQPLTVAYLDIDGLKVVNDTLGHAVGDDLIRTVAEALRESVRDADIVIRMGGDEFCIALCNCTRAQAEQVVGRVHSMLAAASRQPGRHYAVSASHGLCDFTGRSDEGCDMQGMLESADRAMYAAKREKKSRSRSDAGGAQVGASGQLDA